MNLNTVQKQFWVAVLIVLVAEATRWVSGVYDDLSTAKLVGVLVIAVGNALLNGLQSGTALNTEPKPKDPTP